jgi:hypothetical protein
MRLCNACTDTGSDECCGGCTKWTYIGPETLCKYCDSYFCNECRRFADPENVYRVKHCCLGPPVTSSGAPP